MPSGQGRAVPWISYWIVKHGARIVFAVPLHLTETNKLIDFNQIQSHTFLSLKGLDQLANLHSVSTSELRSTP